MSEIKGKLTDINHWIDQRESEGNLEKAEKALLSLRAEHPDEDLICGKLSSVYFYRGLFTKDDQKRELFYEHGTNFGKEAINMNPRAIYGNFWYASNAGQLGICQGIMASLASIDPFKKSMEVVLKENENFFFAGPHRALGRLFHQAPGWPISVGNKNKAAEHLERAVELAPEFFNNRSFLAELYLDMGKKDNAREHLEYLVGSHPKPDHAIEDSMYRNYAVEALKRFF
ncbi:MAG: hypothetical protein RH862_09625 [Leptospiraceae bacterium]